MIVKSKFERVARVLLIVQGTLLLTYLALCGLVLMNIQDPVYVVLIALFGFILASCTLRSFMELKIMRDEKRCLSKAHLQRVIIDATHTLPIITVVCNEFTRDLYRVHKVYNKDINKPIVDKDSKVLYIPFAINIYYAQEL